MTGKTDAPLPKITAGEAERRGLWTLRQFAEWADITMDVAYDVSGDAGFPKPVAVAPPSNSQMRRASALKAWFQDWSQHPSPQRERAAKLAALPKITAEEAERRGLWTAHQFAEWAGLTVSTIYDLAGREGFPAPVAAVPSRGVHPRPVRDRDAGQAWLEPHSRVRAAWTDRVEQITQRRANGDPTVLSITALCDAAGLKRSTVWSNVRRTKGPVRGAMAHLARPAYRVGTDTPYWSQAQCDAYLKAKATQEQERAATIAKLPEVTAEEAQRRGLWTQRQLAAWAGFAPSSFHRLANLAGFPSPEARLPSGGSRPYVLRDRAKVEAWLRQQDPSWRPRGEQQ